MLTIRSMNSDEAEAIQKLGKQIFEPFDALMISKPQNCILALENEEILGAVIYKYLHLESMKLLYVEFIFVRESIKHKGVGKKLLDACMTQGIKEKCSGFSAIIRDDNVASWKLFLDKGFERIQFKELISIFGMKDSMQQLFKTHFGFATGMAYYVKVDRPHQESKRERTSSQVLNYLLLTALSVMPFFFKGMGVGINWIGAIVTMLIIRMIGGYLLTRFTKDVWIFRLTEGGYLIPLIASLFGGVYFLCGNWYPKVYSKGSDFRKTLGLASLGQWLALNIIILLNAFVLRQSDFLNLVTFFASFMMVLSLVPFNPFASFGGKRLFDWNKGVYALIVVLSLGTLIFADRKWVDLL